MDDPVHPSASHPLSSEVRLIAVALALGGIFVLGATLVVLLAYRAGIPPFDLLRDPAGQFGFPIYGGIISNVGVSVLTLAAGVAGVGALFGPIRRLRFAQAALLSALLAIDDQYMLHEVVGPEILGIPEIGFFILYGATALAILATIGPRLSHLRHLPLLIAGAALAASIAIDLVLPMNAYTVLAEDMAKLGGLVIWLVYWTAETGRLLRHPARA